MWCEACGAESAALVCVACGSKDIEARLRYRDHVRDTIVGWNRAGVVHRAALALMLERLVREKQALVAVRDGQPVPEAPKRDAQPAADPAPAPVVRQGIRRTPPPAVAPVAAGAPPVPVRPPPVPPAPAVPPPLPALALPQPRPARAEAARPSLSLDGWLRESAGWLVGASLTVVGSVYLAGTLWADLSVGWRTVITLLFLGAWSLGFGAVGRRLVARGLGAGRWLIGVGAALAPVHAMAAGALWPSLWAAPALAVVGVVQGWALWRATRDLAPGAGARLWAPWLALALSAGLMPLHLGPVVPTLLVAAAAWALGIRRGPALSASVLLGTAWALHPLFGGLRGLDAMALPLALLSAIALYADLAVARWRGLVRVGLEGWRGIGVAALALVALAATVPTFHPLPSGLDVMVTYAVVGALAFLAALAWRRPVLVGLTLFGGIGVAVTVPSLARELVALVASQASVGLGYGGSPLPLAWRALTLLPWLCVWLVGARLVSRTSWRQAPELVEHMRRWAFGIGLALLAFSTSIPGDARPFVFAAPLYAAVGLLRPRLGVSKRVGIGISVVPIVAGAVWFALVPSTLPAALGLPALVGRFTLAGWLGGVALLWRDRTAAIAVLPLSAVLVALDPAGLGPLAAGVVGLAWLVSPARDEDAAPWLVHVRSTVAAVAPGVFGVGIAQQVAGSPDVVGAFAGLGTTAVIAACSTWVARTGRTGAHALLGWAAVGVGVTALLGLDLDDPARLVLRLGLGALLLGWTWEHRALQVRGVPVAAAFGAALAAGIAESAARRLIEADLPVTVGLSGAAVAVSAWSVLAGRLGRTRPWLTAGVAGPAQLVTALVVIAGVVAAQILGLPTLVAALGTVPLVVAVWLVAPRGDEAPAWVAVALGACTSVVAVPAGLALGLVRLPVVGAVAIGVAALSGAWHGPLGAGWVGLAAGAVALTVRARGEPVLRAPAVVALLGVAGLAVEATVHPPIGAYLAALVTVGAAMAAVRWVAAAPWREEIAVTGHWMALASIPALIVDLGVVQAPGPAEVFTGAAAAAYALAVRQPWAARVAAVSSLVSALWWLDGPLAAWIVVATLALAADRASIRRALRLEEAVLHFAGAASVAVALAFWVVVPPGPAATVLPMALCWPVLAWVGGGALVRLLDGHAPQTVAVPIGFAAALVHAGARGEALDVGLALAAAALAVERVRPVRSAVLVLGGASLLGAQLGTAGWAPWAELAVMAGLAAVWSAHRPHDLVARGTGSAVTALGALVVGIVGMQRWAVGDASVIGFGPLWVVGLAALGFPGVARAVLAPIGVALMALGAVLAAPPIPWWQAGPWVTIGLALVVAVHHRLAERWPHRLDGRPDRDVVLVLAQLAPVPTFVLMMLPKFGPTMWFVVAVALQGVFEPRWVLLTVAAQWLVVAGVATLGRRAEVAVMTAAVALGVTIEAIVPAPWAVVVQLALMIAVGWAAAPVAPRVSQVLRAALPAAGAVAAATVGLPLPGWGLLALGVALELAAALRGGVAAQVWVPVVHAGLVLAAARVVGPLASVPSSALVPLAVVGAMALEAGGTWLARRGEAWATPLRHAAVALVGVALMDGLAHGVPGAFGLAAAGGLFVGRHALRGALGDLLAGVILMDLGAMVFALDAGLDDPLFYVAPVSLSALIVAQRLRGTVHPDAIAFVRYVAAGSTYVTCFGQGLVDPLFTSLLVLLAVVGILAGEVLRVRSYLHLGVGFLLAALGWNLVRFGLNHSGFWALYLTGLGLLVLAGMVVVTLNRDLVRRVRRWMSAHLSAWEA